MPSVIPGFEYDIFISYRHNDNRSGWVTEFVNALQEELAATIKEPLSIYFDKNLHDGLLETHNVDKSLEGKLKCLIFIPIISQTYCDTKSFAWQNEFVAFNKLAKADTFGRDIKLSNGNVASRILPIKIHDIDLEDKKTIETEIGGVLRAIEFIYKEAGVNRPLKSTDSKTDNLNKTDYQNQVNKVANSIKGLTIAIQHPIELARETQNQTSDLPKSSIKKMSWAAALLAVLASIIFCYYYFGGFGNALASQLDPSIAVIPFVNMSNEPEQESFSDGMTDEVLNQLYKIGNLKVISRTSSMKFKGAKLTAKEIAKQLGVTNILEGGIQSAGNRIKITVQLIDALTDNHLWSETYEREFIDIFSIQADIATSVARELKIKLGTQYTNNSEVIPTKSKLAYEFYLKGKSYVATYDLDKAIAMFSNAIKEDSLFALAYAVRAHAYLFRYWLRGPGWEENKEPAYRDIEILKKLNPDLPELKVALAYWHYYCFRDYDKALTLVDELKHQTPNDPELHRILAAIYRRQGKWNESIREKEKTLTLDPLDASGYNELCLTYGTMHRYKDQLKVARRGLSLIPEFSGFRFQILYAEVNLLRDFDVAFREANIPKEEFSWFKDYIKKNYESSLSQLRKQQGTVLSYQGTYEPITLSYARNNFLERKYSLAKIYADSSVAFLLKKLPDMLEDERIYMSLGISYAILGQETNAIKYGEKGMQLLPVSRDAWSGGNVELNMVDIYLFLGKYDLALDKIERLLSIPSDLGIGWLLVDPKYESLHKLPRFKKLVEKYK